MNWMQPRRWLLGGALVLTLAAMYLVDAQDAAEDLAQPPATPRKARLRLPSEHSASLPLSTWSASADALPDLARSRAAQVAAVGHGNADLWQAHLAASSAGLAQATLPEAPLLPAAPTVPPLPYQYMGQMDDAPEGSLVFLTARDRVFSIRPGQTVEQVWRLDRLDAQALYLTYLPLNTTVVLSKTAKQVVAAHTAATEDQPTDR